MHYEQYVLLEKFLADTCTEAERIQVRKLLDTPEGKAALYQVMSDKDAEKPSAAVTPAITPEGAYIRRRLPEMKTELHRRIDRSEASESRKQIWRPHWGRVAAWIGVLLSIGFISYQYGGWGNRKNESVHMLRVTNESGIPTVHRLPDSSTIYLAAGSYLTYPEQFPDSGRTVELTGQAFFDVTSDKKRPFKVRSGTVQTNVLGTSFRISAFTGETVEVAVASGSVSVADHQQAPAGRSLGILTAGEQLAYDLTAHNVQKSMIDAHEFESWKNGELLFDDLPMEIIAKQLERRYQIQIAIASPTIRDYRLSGSFPPEENVEQILSVLGQMAEFHYKKLKDNRYELSRKE